MSRGYIPLLLEFEEGGGGSDEDLGVAKHDVLQETLLLQQHLKYG